MPTAVSAPGKVLLAGGYLVLDRTYSGLVFGLSARIHVVVQDVERDADDRAPAIVVRSPQFRDAEWTYAYQIWEDMGRVEVTQLPGSTAGPGSSNPFVETALSYALGYVYATTRSAVVRPALVTILADGDYYSHSGEVPPSMAVASTPFVDFGVRLQDAHKTGLGSSAALVTAFTGALLSHYLSESQFSISSSIGRAILHNLSQAAHCAAQGKIGSGFDVAAAVYGSCMYRRFSPSILSALGEPSSAQFAPRLKLLVEDLDPQQRWDTEIKKGDAQLPPGMALVMCDVDCGSQTVSMVKKVLEWRKRDPASAKLLWDQLQAHNEILAGRLLSGTPEQLSETISAIRARIRDMGERSGVPIEPPEQTELLNAVADGVDGVIGGVVPGAGGYDAVVLLVEDKEDTLAHLRSFLKNWSQSKTSNVKLLNVKGEVEGARKQDDKIYKGWIK